MNMNLSSPPLLSSEQEQQPDHGCGGGAFPSSSTKGTVTRGEESEICEHTHIKNDDADNPTVTKNNNDKFSGSSSSRINAKSSVTIPTSSLHQHLICSLCNGYFRDPHTISDCLHTFCRICLVMYFRHGSIDICCPTCNTRLGADPFRTSIVNPSQEIMPDRRLYEIVNKIFPHLKQRDEEAERRFYAQRGIKLKAEYADTIQETAKAHGRSGEDSQMIGDEQLDLNLEPDESPPQFYQRLPSLRCPILRLSGRAKIASLKKYLVMKLGLKDLISSIELLCNGDPMGDELSLSYINKICWLPTNNDVILVLKYRLEDGSDTIANHLWCIAPAAFLN